MSKKIKNTNLISVGVIIFCCTVLIFLAMPTKAADKGCCEKVVKTTLKFEVEDMDEEACLKIKTEETGEDAKYENVFWFKGKTAFLGRCRSENEINEGDRLPKFTIPDIKVNIPGLIKFAQPDFCSNDDEAKICINWIGQYIGALANYLTVIIGIIAAITLMFGGVRWLTAAGNSQAISDAKKWILNSLLGLVLTLCAYILLATINPNLVTFTPLRITWLEAISLKNLKTAGGDCNNGECTQIDEAIANNSEGLSGSIMKSILVGGEGCSPALSGDGLKSCGYCQALPQYRTKICGLKGDASDCELFKKDIQADINCSAKFLVEFMKTCTGGKDDIRTLASCYNSGSPVKCGTNNYCERVEKYYNEDCQKSKTP